MAAARGHKINTLIYLLSNRYTIFVLDANGNILPEKVRLGAGLLAKDKDDNTALHFSYQKGEDGRYARFCIRQYLTKVYGIDGAFVQNMLNTRGLKPKEMNHALKYEDSDDAEF